VRPAQLLDTYMKMNWKLMSFTRQWRRRLWSYYTLKMETNGEMFVTTYETTVSHSADHKPRLKCIKRDKTKLSYLYTETSQEPVQRRGPDLGPTVW
jgi:hypothetical protein